MTHYREHSSASSAPAATGPGTPDSPLPASNTSNNIRFYSRNNDSSMNQRTDRSNDSASRPTRPLSREDLLNQAIARMNVRDESSAPDHRIRPKSEGGTQDHRHVPHRVHSLDDITPSGGGGSTREWVEHTRAAKDNDELLPGPDKDPDQATDDGQESEATDDGASTPQEDKTRGEPQACLFVASLAASRTDVQLVESVTEHFQKWGKLLNVKVLKDWMQRPYSFVQFENVEDAQRAMVEAQNTIIDGRHIRIEQARVNRTLFILRFARSTTEQDLIDALEQYGPVEDVSIFHDPRPARNRRYAFAKFAYRDDAIKAYVALRATSRWTVEWAPNLSNQNQIEKESVFVGQLNPDLVTESALRDRFEPYGSIQSIYLVKRSKPGTGRPIAFAFIEFDNEHAARRAIDNENNTQFLDTTLRVQHRETSEFRVQRQNAAMQAARNLIDDPAIPRPPAPSAAPHGSGYGPGFQPYRGPGVGRPMYYPPFYGYGGVPVPLGYYPPPPQPASMLGQPGATPRGPPTSSDNGQAYYQGPAPYNNRANQPEHFGSNQDVGRQDQRSGYQQYPGYGQGPEGMYYPPGSLYMYEQNPAGPVPVAGSGSPGPSGTHGAAPLPPVIGPPMWYGPPPMTGVAMPKRPGLPDVTSVVPPRFGSTAPSHGPESSARPADPRGPAARKFN
ncbi:hypothetical protein BGX23_006591 [Mortierella sp. AD031]|nr:hypothetical protein BGX23_006591 [Mortierella sp. AD031]